MTSQLAVALSQFAPSLDTDANVQQLREHAQLAHERGAQLLIAPEYASGFQAEQGDWMRSVAQPIDGDFVRQVAQLARDFALTIVVGMLETGETSGPSPAASAKPFNTLVAINPEGNVIARYRKVHLYDAYGASETSWVAAGASDQAPAVFDLGPFRIGMQTCYDVRFPEVSRRLLDAGATVLAVPAEWAAGHGKLEHWQTLLRARAIENVAFVVAADQPGPVAVGSSMAIDPKGVVLAATGNDTALIVTWLDEELLTSARVQNPAVQLRRYRVAEGASAQS